MGIVSQIKKIKFVRKFLGGTNSDTNVLKNITKLSAGTGVAKLIAIFSTPVISRIYLPEHMGVFSLFTAIIALIIPFTTLQYSLAIPLPKSNLSAMHLVSISFIIALLVSIIAFSAFGLFGYEILESFNALALLDYWVLIPLGILLTAFYEILTSWSVRVKSFGKYSKTIVWQNALGSCAKIFLGLLGLKPLGLLIGQIFTQAGGTISLFKAFYNEVRNDLRKLSPTRLRFYATYYIGFPKFRLPAQILLTLSIKLPLLFFAWNFGAQETGQLGLALMMVGLPMRLFGETTAKAFYSEVAAIGDKYPERIYQLTKSITFKLSLLSIVPFLILFFLGPWLFKLYFGEVWSEAGKYASILSFYLLTQFVYSPIGNGIFNVYKKQHVVLLINSIRILLIGATFFIAHVMHYSSKTTLYMYSLSLSAYYLITILVVFYLLRSAVNK